MIAPACASLSVRSGARVVSSAAGLVPACRELPGLWPAMAQISVTGGAEHLPAQFLASTEPSGHSLRPRVVGMTFRTFAERQVGSAAVRAVLQRLGSFGRQSGFARRVRASRGLRRQPRPAAPRSIADERATRRQAATSCLSALPAIPCWSLAAGFSTKCPPGAWACSTLASTFRDSSTVMALGDTLLSSTHTVWGQMVLPQPDHRRIDHLCGLRVSGK